MGVCGSRESALDAASPSTPPEPNQNQHQQHNQIRDNQTQHNEEQKQDQPQPNGVSPSPSSSIGMSDDEYRSQLKSIFLFLLDRLLQTMEYERQWMRWLAAAKAKQSKGAHAAHNGSTTSEVSYLTLFAGDKVATFLTRVLALDAMWPPTSASSSSSSSSANTSTPSASSLESAFSDLVSHAANAHYRRSTTTDDNGNGNKNGTDVVMSRHDLTKQLQTVCSDMQLDLGEAINIVERETRETAAEGEKRTGDEGMLTAEKASQLRTHLDFFMRTLNFSKGDIANDSQLLERNVEAIIAASSA